MRLHNKRTKINFIIFLLIAIIYAIGNFIWWSINTPIIPTWESAIHFVDVFKRGYLFYNAPLLAYIMRFMFYIFGKEYFDLTVIFVNYIFFLISLYFIYKIGVELKDKETGNIAMILFALVPAVYGMSRQYGRQEYHIMVAITFNIYCLIKTDYFRDRKWSILYGISVGLGLMIKDVFLMYFFVPFIYNLIICLKDKFDKTKLINIVVATFIGFFICGWHYFRSEIIKKLSGDPFKNTVSVFEFENLRVMTIGLWEELLSPPIFILFAVGLIYFIWKYKGQYKNIVLLWFVIPWMVIMFMPHYKIPEYGMGLIPAMMLIGAVFIASINKKYIKKIITSFLIIIGILQYIDFSYRICDRNIFDISYKNSKYEFKYYLKDNPLLSNKYDNEILLNLKVCQHLLKYPNKKCAIDSFNRSIDVNGLVNYANINNIYCFWSRLDDKNILKADIIVIFGNQSTVQQLVDLIKNKFIKDPVKSKISKEYFKKEITEPIEFIFNKVQANYHIIDIFYLDENKNENTKVTLLGRKDKFPQFSQ